MSLGVTEDDQALTAMVRRWASDSDLVGQSRAACEADGDPGLPQSWTALAAQGLLGIHLAEEHGGGGAGTVELAIALAELGRALAPGPVLPTLLASTLLAAHAASATAKDLLPGFAEGTSSAAVALGCEGLTATADGDGVRLSGATGPVLGAGQSDLLVLGARTDDREVWVLLDAVDAEVTTLPALDGSRALGSIALHGVAVAPERILNGLDAVAVRETAAALFAAEAAGIADWCLATAADYAKVREQFGRPIGQFQAVKHACADMLVQAELARAVAWDAARALDDPEQRSLACAVAAGLALDAAVHNAKACIQILGGIGFTWEHDAHLYLRRALSVRQLLDGGDRWRERVADLALSGARRNLELALPAEAQPVREEVAAFLASLDGLAEPEQRRRMADEGYIVPHWPAPWGRDAGAVEQLVIDEQFRAAGVKRPNLIIGNWVLPTIIEHGTAEQQERFVRPTLHGEIIWCQMFSEPGAGSDLASLSTKATRTEGGWLLNGQKVWTSVARYAHWGICLARTNPDVGKHQGITYFLVDMASEGVDVRPLRELTGHDMFNEVFLDDVLVPDDCVVGEVDAGWQLARTTLANERVAMSSGSVFGAGVEGVVELLDDSELDLRGAARGRVGALVCEGQASSLLAYRITLRQLSGVDPGPTSSVRKLVGMHHQQDAAELGLELLGPQGATTHGRAAHWTHQVLSSRSLTIAGGTSEVLRNVIAERLLGLPRDDA